MSVTTSASSSPVRLPRTLIAVDIAERLVMIALFANFLRNIVFGASAGFNPISLLLVVSEFLPVLFICLRGPSASMSMRPSDWFLGFAGAAAPLMVITVKDADPLLPLGFCVLLMLAGLIWQIAAKIFLGRSFGLIAANRGVRVAGPYRVMRHPMYAGYVTTHIAFLLASPSAFNFAVYTIGFGIQIIRILREEDVLMKDAGYREYAAGVRYRLVPGVW